MDRCLHECLPFSILKYVGSRVVLFIVEIVAGMDGAFMKGASSRAVSLSSTLEGIVSDFTSRLR